MTALQRTPFGQFRLRVLQLGKDAPPATRLTHDFLTAVEEFSASPFIKDAFGEAYQKLYGDTKRKEAITYLRTVSDFDYQTYLPRI